MGEFIEFSRMTNDQQQQVCDHLVCKAMPLEALPDWKFYVRNDGRVTRQKGCHKMTEATERNYNAMIARGYGAPAPSKDQPVVFGSGTRFSISNQ